MSPLALSPCHGVRTSIQDGPWHVRHWHKYQHLFVLVGFLVTGTLGLEFSQRAAAPCFVLAVSQVQIKLDFGFFFHKRTAPLMKSPALWRTGISLISKLTEFTPLAATHTASFPKESKIHGPKLEAFLPLCLIVMLQSEH